jgi:FG-GAP-like repeat
MRNISRFIQCHFAVLLFASLVFMAGIAPTCLANQLFPVQFQREPLSLPNGTYFDSKVVDLNADGNMDLAVLSDEAFFILLGDGSGNFSLPTPYNQGGFQTVLAFGDFNGDGFPDAAVANFPGINVLLNDGKGGFPNSVFINTGEEPSGLAVADFNLDGNLDLAVSDFQANSISILLGDGNGGFAAPVISAAGTSPAGLVVADFNHDGVPDLAAAEYGTVATGGDLRIFKGVGDGTFQTTASYPLGGNTNIVVRADFNHDGNADLAVGVFNSNSQVAVFLGDGNGGFAQSDSVLGTALYGSLATADIDGNQTPDLVFLDRSESKVDVALGNGDGTFRRLHEVSLPHSGASYTLSTGDLNGDGRTDIFTPLDTGTGVLLFNMP